MAEPKVVVLDYGSGNLRSASRALARVGADVEVSADIRAAAAADGLVVPGVGAFRACIQGIKRVGGDHVMRERLADSRPTLGICVGMQVMFDGGAEHGADTEGLGLLPGLVDRLPAEILPHMGWNTVEAAQGSALFRGVAAERFYFVHSYAVQDWKASAAAWPPARATWSQHGGRFVAAVEHGSLAATQFHPEKSGDAGLAVLRNWVATLR